MSDIEHSGLHQLFFLDGIAAGAEKALQQLEEALVSQQHALQDAVNDLGERDMGHNYALGDISALKDAADDVRLAARRVVVARSSISARTS